MTYYREIDVSQLARVVPADQPVPALQWINIADLVIDDRYQRPMGPANWKAVERIAAGFDWAKFAAVQVAPVVAGRFAVIDGQHRAHAAAVCGFDQVPCLCVTVAPGAQARAFVGMNASAIRINKHQMYRAALAAGEGWAMACDAAVVAGGCALATAHPSSKNKKPRVVYSIDVIQRAVAAGQDAAVSAALAAVVAFDQKARVALYSDYILAPWIAAVAAHPAHLRADLVAVLGRLDPFKVVDRAKMLDGKGSARAKAQALFEVMIRGQIKAVAA